MRAVIYTRVSSDPTGRGRSVSEQEAECRAVCAREGWQVAEVLTDNDIGASRWSGKQRPAYERLQTVLQSGDVLVTWEASRAQRDMTAYVALRDLCAARGVLWSYGGKLYDLAASDDRFTTGLGALLAEKEADLTRERVLRAHRAAAEQGRAHGRIPYGYRAVRDPGTGKVIARVPDENEAPIVVESVARLLEGETAQSIVNDFARRGVSMSADGSRWPTHILARMLCRPVYAGIRSHRGVETSGDWEPLISVDDHRRIVSMLRDPRRITHRGNTSPTYLISSLAACGVCGSPIGTLKKSPTRRVYVCKQRGCVSRVIGRVDDLIELAMIEMLSGIEPADLQSDDDRGDASAQSWQLARSLRDRIDEAADAHANGDLSLSTLTRIEATLEPQIAEAEAAARHTARSPILSQFAGRSNAEEIWNGMSLLDKRMVIRAVCTIKITRGTGELGNRWDPTAIELDWL